MVLASAGLTFAAAVSWQLMVSFTYLMVDLTDCWLAVAAEVSGLCESYPLAWASPHGGLWGSLEQ